MKTPEHGMDFFFHSELRTFSRDSALPTRG